MMLIGEVARLAGVSTRTIRHYHHVGVLPEPARAASGFRENQLPEVLQAIRAVRLAEKGLSLAEVADVLLDRTGGELRSVLEDLLLDLDHEQAQLESRRRGVREMLVRAGNPDLAHLAAMPPSIAAATASDPALREREQLAWASIAAPLPEADGEALALAIEELFDDPGQAQEMTELATTFDALIDADDPAVSETARRMVALGRLASTDQVGVDADQALIGALAETLTAGQRRCLQLVEQAMA